MGVDSDGDAKIKDDRGTIDSHFRRNYALFRKAAAATNPSVEERVAKAEGEIESLKSDVAALKGEAEYKRIGKSEAQAGDYVKFIETDDSSLTVGKMYVIKEIDYDGDPLITDDDDDENWAGTGEEFEIYRKVNAASVEAEPKPERLKVGDYAKVVNADQHTMDGFSVGDIVEIVESEYGEHDVDFYVMSLAGDNSGYIRKTPEYIVRATDEEVAEAKRAAAEATERKKWAEIGREVGEYKVGDIFRNPDGILFEITRIDARLAFPIRFTNLEGDDDGYMRKANLTLITPVEARFDR
ncbi:hypothetical protein P9B01_02805 [Bacillus subtilis]|uniref:hypothetical protein n=1 Tax=Bacillus subtilis TaxID=1423 RepID=UPI002DBABE41|nr:hypothetical protein [Bacillus subtilis]MEC1007979.1 hypothetical protein [Bacillus subtilis]MEC1072799.1 hypothetical protein [Bacillus subtilis]